MNRGYQVVRPKRKKVCGEGKIHCSLHIPPFNVGKVKTRGF